MSTFIYAFLGALSALGVYLMFRELTEDRPVAEDKTARGLITELVETVFNGTVDWKNRVANIHPGYFNKNLRDAINELDTDLDDATDDIEDLEGRIERSVAHINEGKELIGKVQQEILEKQAMINGNCTQLIMRLESLASALGYEYKNERTEGWVKSEPTTGEVGVQTNDGKKTK